MKVVTAEEMAAIELACEAEGITTGSLMENAGLAVASEVRRILGSVKGRRIVFLIGPGNNGGDGLVAARHLSDWGAEVILYCGRRPEADPNLEKLKERGLECLGADLLRALDGADVVMDSFFGTGGSRPLAGFYKEALEVVSGFKKQYPKLQVIALDLPSGLSSDDDTIDPACLCAVHTVTLGLPKRGLYGPNGAVHSGEVTIVDIGIPPHLAAGIVTGLMTPEDMRALLPIRSATANKGSFGRVLVVAGSINYIGAAYLASTAAARAGAGLVTLATPESLQPILACKMAEVTYLPLKEANFGITSEEASETVLSEISRYDVLLLGCGLGQHGSTAAFVRKLLAGLPSPAGGGPKLVLDADALNILSAQPDWWRGLDFEAVLTPHPGEMARLSGMEIRDVQRDRIGLAQRLAARWRKVLVIKGAHTVVAAPDGQGLISPSANAGLASAGTGDVLAGVIAGLLAQGLSHFYAAALGVYLHAVAGEMARDDMGDAGILASDLLPLLPRAIKQLEGTC